MNDVSKIKQVPRTTVDWKRRFHRQKLYGFLFAILLAIITFYISYSYLEEKEAGFELETVIVATGHMAANIEVAEENIKIKHVPKKYIPMEAMRERREIIGQITRHSIEENEIITTHAIKEILRSDSLVSKLEEGEEAFALSEKWLSSPFPKLFEGDRIDVIASVPGQQLGETKVIASGLKVIEVEQQLTFGGKKVMTVSTSEEQIRNLLFGYTNKARMVVVLRNE